MYRRGICGQRRPRSDCAFAQSDQGLRFPLTGSFYTFNYTDVRFPAYQGSSGNKSTLKVQNVHLRGWGGAFFPFTVDTFSEGGKPNLKELPLLKI